jgi:DNA-binding response OmpR family regulator
MKKLLLIEDDQIVANIYRNKFTVEGFQVEIALDGEAGLKLANTFAPDIVILDLILPKMSGVDVLRHLRAREESKRIPVVVLSNTYLSQMVREAWRAGATKCLSKANCTPNHVIEVVLGVFRGQTKGKAAPAVPAAPSRGRPEPATPAPAAAVKSDEQFQTELRQQFIEGLPAALAALRTNLQGLVKGDDEARRMTLLHELYRKIHALTGNAGIAGLLLIAQMSAALEALVKELHDKPENINASTLRTVALAIDFLGTLFDRAATDGAREVPTAQVLVVDDEAISRRAISYALEKARLKAVNAEDPQTALKLLNATQFDLIILDIDMPGMTGFELCGNIRTLPNYAKTPVVFVTSLTDFESRANSTISGGNDLIAKPFLFIELAVKALLYVLRNRLGPENK